VKHFLQSIVQGLHSVQTEIAAGRQDSSQASRYCKKSIFIFVMVFVCIFCKHVIVIPRHEYDIVIIAQVRGKAKCSTRVNNYDILY